MLWGEIYEEITDRLNADGTFENSNNIRGYYIEFLLTRNVILNDNLSATITHDVEIDYSLPSDEQLQGKAALVSLLDSKDATATPTHNYQKIYVIAPEISGTIKYQKLANEQQLPSWNKAQNIANIPVHLLKKNGSIIASIEPKADGTFIFSNALVNEKTFSLDHSLEKLYISIDGKGKTEWRDITGTVSLNTARLPLGTIIDISKSQSIFDTAFFKTEWNAGYISYNPEGRNALGSQCILTDVEEEEVTDEVTDEITDEITNEITDNVTDENSTSNNDKLTTTGNRTGDIIILVGYIVLILSAITYIIVKKYRKMNH